MSYITNTIRGLLSNATMYTLAGGGLAMLLLVALVFSSTGKLPFSPLALLTSTVLLVGVSYAANYAFGLIAGAARNRESAIITAYILALIMPPATSLREGAILVVCAVAAQASKYLIAYRRQHVFNPAAFGAFAIGLIGFVQASWWVGSAVMLPFTLLLGVALLTKLRRFQLFFVFTGIVIAELLLFAIFDGANLAATSVEAFVSWPLIFFATIMLTEPLTAPGKKRYLLIFGVLAALLFAGRFSFGVISATPELALLAANLFAFAAAFTYRGTHKLTLKRLQRIGPRNYSLTFASDTPARFQAGQYGEWTLPHNKSDARGTRRQFTIASAPSSKTIELAFKAPDRASSFKQALMHMQPGAKLTLSNISGDFVLPNDPAHPLVFIAGGVGITPFHSMITHLVNIKEQRQITLIYIVRDNEELMYQGELEAAANYGFNVLVFSPEPIDFRSTVSWHTLPFSFDSSALQPQQFSSSLFYISGAPYFVSDMKTALRTRKVPSSAIRTDHFDGY